MSIIRYEPNQFMREFRDEINRLFNVELGGTNAATSNWTPAVDIKEETDKFVIFADIPGVDPKDIDIHMENGMLTIKGEKRFEKETEEKGFKRKERSYGSFYRQFLLPDTANTESISAKSRHGVTEIIIPKKAIASARKIDIASE